MCSTFPGKQDKHQLIRQISQTNVTSLRIGLKILYELSNLYKLSNPLEMIILRSLDCLKYFTMILLHCSCYKTSLFIIFKTYIYCFILSIKLLVSKQKVKIMNYYLTLTTVTIVTTETELPPSWLSARHALRLRETNADQNLNYRY